MGSEVLHPLNQIILLCHISLSHMLLIGADGCAVAEENDICVAC